MDNETQTENKPNEFQPLEQYILRNMKSLTRLTAVEKGTELQDTYGKVQQFILIPENVSLSVYDLQTDREKIINVNKWDLVNITNMNQVYAISAKEFDEHFVLFGEHGENDNYDENDSFGTASDIISQRKRIEEITNSNMSLKEQVKALAQEKPIRTLNNAMSRDDKLQL